MDPRFACVHVHSACAIESFCFPCNYAYVVAERGQDEEACKIKIKMSMNKLNNISETKEALLLDFFFSPSSIAIINDYVYQTEHISRWIS